MPNPRHTISKVRKICLSLPDTKEDEKWGKPHFCVNKKIFAGCGDEEGKLVVGCKLEMAHAKRIVQLPGFSKAAYVGHKGWISIDLSEVTDWRLIEELVNESYRLIAPRKSVALLDGESNSKPTTPVRKKK